MSDLPPLPPSDEVQAQREPRLPLPSQTRFERSKNRGHKNMSESGQMSDLTPARLRRGTSTPIRRRPTSHRSQRTTFPGNAVGTAPDPPRNRRDASEASIEPPIPDPPRNRRDASEASIEASIPVTKGRGAKRPRRVRFRRQRVGGGSGERSEPDPWGTTVPRKPPPGGIPSATKERMGFRPGDRRSRAASRRERSDWREVVGEAGRRPAGSGATGGRWSAKPGGVP